MIQGQQNWSYSHTEHAWPIVHAFIDRDPYLNTHAVLKQKLQTIQNVECNNHLRGGIINLYNMFDTSWMIAMYNADYKYAVVWFDGTWPATEDFNLLLLDEIDKYNKQDPNWMVAGQIQCERTGIYPHFSRSLVIINLEVWNKHQVGPLWEPARHPNWQPDENGRKWEDSAYCLTPADGKWKKDEEYRYINQDVFATSWIQYSLLRDLRVWGITDTLMDTITLIKPWLGADELERGLSGEFHDPSEVSFQGKKLLDSMNIPSSPIYFCNTEPSAPTTSSLLEDSVFDQYVGPTAGFKLLYYAYKYGVNPGFTRFVWFDFDEDSVRFKRDTLKMWDGEDYPAWVEQWCKNNPDANADLLDLTKERWPNVVDQFGGQQSWQNFWTQISFCDHTVLQADLIHNQQELFNKIQNLRTFFWGSNIYSYIIPKILCKPFVLERSFMNLIEKIQQTNDESWYSGTDVNDADLMCPARVIGSATNNLIIGLEE